VDIKYLGGLHNYIRREVTLLNPKTIDEAYVEDIHVEYVKKKQNPNGDELVPSYEYLQPLVDMHTQLKKKI